MGKLRWVSAPPSARPGGIAAWARALVLTSLCGLATGCALRHSALVEPKPLPPPAGPHVVHTGRLVIVLSDDTQETQCVKNDRYRGLCFEGVRSTFASSLQAHFWPTYHQTLVGSPEDVTEDDYLLEVGVSLEPLPPDADGPGWSAGAKAHYRLTRAGQLLKAETLSSRSRADLPYGAPLGGGASDTLAAVSYHIADQVSRVPESRPDTPPPLPTVAARSQVD